MRINSMIKFKKEIYAVSISSLHKHCSLNIKFLRITSQLDGITTGAIYKKVELSNIQVNYRFLTYIFYILKEK